MNAETENGACIESTVTSSGERSASAWALLIALQQRGISVRREMDELRVSKADLARITPDEMKAMRHLRHEMIALLRPVAQEASGQRGASWMAGSR